MLVTARKFVELKAATADDGEIEAPRPVEALPRHAHGAGARGRDSAVAQARERAIRVGVS